MNKISENLLPLLDVSVLLLGFFIIIFVLTFNSKNKKAVSVSASKYSIVVVNINSNGTFKLDSGSQYSFSNAYSLSNKIKELWPNNTRPWTIVIPENLYSNEINNSILEVKKVFDNENIKYDILTKE